MIIFIFIYRVFYNSLRFLILLLKPFLDHKKQLWIAERSALSNHQFDSIQLTSCIWFHASSGEIEYVKAIIKKIKTKYPQEQIIVTYSSLSAKKLFNNLKPNVKEFIPLPWDTATDIKKLIQLIKPKILIFGRTDIWPELIYQCHQHKIKLGVVSFFPNFNMINNLLIKIMMPLFDFISCTDEATKEKLIQLLSPYSKLKIRSDGDTRFDQVFSRINETHKKKYLDRTNFKEPIIIFGSTWPEDEKYIYPLLNEIFYLKHKVIICPHDISTDRIESLTSYFNTHKLSFKKISELNSPYDFNSNILLVDQVGILADLYSYCDIAFIGGSYKSRVHSVMEALCCGLPVLTGPLIKNSPEAVRYSRSSSLMNQGEKFVYISQSSEDLIENYHQILAKLKKYESSQIKHLKTAIISEMEKNKGASDRITELILTEYLGYTS